MMSTAARPRVYCAFVEVRPLENCEVLDPKDAAGAYIRCYVQADSESDARKQIDESLTADLFHIEAYEWCVDVDDTDWEDPSSEEAAECIEQARRNPGVIAGDVNAWSVD